MKKLLLLLAVTLCINIQAQQIIINGTKITATTSNRVDLDIKIPKTKEQLLAKSTKTNNIATYKKIDYPIYMTDKGKFFIIYLNKKGNYTKKYLKENK